MYSVEKEPPTADVVNIASTENGSFTSSLTISENYGGCLSG